jgi:hypothetical protein
VDVIVGGGIGRLSMAYPQSTLLCSEDAFPASGSSPSPTMGVAGPHFSAHSQLTWRAVVGTTGPLPLHDSIQDPSTIRLEARRVTTLRRGAGQPSNYRWSSPPHAQIQKPKPTPCPPRLHSPRPTRTCQAGRGGAHAHLVLRRHWNQRHLLPGFGRRAPFYYHAASSSTARSRSRSSSGRVAMAVAARNAGVLALFDVDDTLTTLR